MRTRKGGNIFTQVGRRFGLYHGPSTSKLMSNFIEICKQRYVNVRPILKDWTVLTNGELSLDPRYEEVFVEIYVKIFYKFIHPFSVIKGFKEKVEKYNASKTKENHFLIETLTLYVQKYVKQEKKIPANAYDWLMDWIDYMETFKPSSEVSNLKKAMVGHRSDTIDPKFDAIFLLPKAPLRTGGEPTKDEPPIYIAPDPIVVEIFLNIIVFLIKLFVIILSGGIVNPYG